MCLSGPCPDLGFSRPRPQLHTPGRWPSRALLVPPPQCAGSRLRPHTSVLILSRSLKVRFLTPDPAFSLISPGPAPSPRSLSAGAPSRFTPLHSQPGRPALAPTRSLSRPHRFPFPAPPTQRLGSGSAPLPRALWATLLTSPRSWPSLSCSLLAPTPPQAHLSRRPAVPQMTFIFSKRMLLTRPLSMAPGNSASRASSTSRWVRSSSGWRSQEREPQHVTLRFSPGSQVPTLDPLAAPARIPGGI